MKTIESTSYFESICDTAALKRAHQLLRLCMNREVRRTMAAITHCTMCVTDLQYVLQIEDQGRMSGILALMRRVGLVDGYKKNRQVYYRLNRTRLRRINVALKHFLER